MKLPLLFMLMFTGLCVPMACTQARTAKYVLQEHASPIQTARTDSSKDVTALAERLQHSIEALRMFITKHASKKQDISRIQTIQKHIQTIEERNGIPPLQKQLAKLRIESCIIQHEKPEIQKILQQINHLKAKIHRQTGQEQKKGSRLIEQRASLRKGDPHYHATKKQIASLQHTMRKKVQKELKAIQKHNREIYNQLREKINEAKPLVSTIAQKYKHAKPQLNPLDRNIASHVKNINRHLSTQKKQLKQLRTSIQELQRTIIKHDPCYFAKQSAKSRDWVHLFI